MSVTTTTASALTAEQVQAILVAPLEEKSVYLAAGPQIFDSANPVRIPKLGSAITDPGFTGESELIPTRDAGFDEVTLLPSTLKSVKVITRFSNELARQAVVALDAALQQRLVTDVANKIDAQFLSATGDGVTVPKGLFAWSGVQNIAVGGALTLDHLHDAYGAALAANVDITKLTWVFKPREVTKLRKLKDADQRYLLQPDPTLASGYSLLGAPVIISNHIPDTTAQTPTARGALVDFSQIAVARDVAPAVTILDQAYAEYDEMALRVVTRMDTKPLNADAVVTLTGITV